MKNSSKPLEVLYIKIVSFVIGIRFYPYEWPFSIEKYFRDRMTLYYLGFLIPGYKGKVDFWIDVYFKEGFETMIKVYERKHFIKIFEETGRNTITTFYTVSNEQFAAVVRKICQALLYKYNGLYIHASAVKVGSSAYIFLGDSGAGKSTIVRILSKKYTPLGDDSIFLKKEGGKFYFYQTPFLEKNAWIERKPEKYNIGKVFFLKKSDKIEVVKLEDKEKAAQLFSSQLISNKGEVVKQMKNILEFVKYNDFYYLAFNLDDEEEIAKMLARLER